MPRKMKGGSVSAHETKQFVEQSYVKSGERDAAVGSYQLDRELSNDRCAVYHDFNSNKTIVVNRGTTGTLQDWSNNAQYMMGTYDDTARMANAEATQDAAIAKYGSVNTNIGHSQGAVITRKLNEQGKTGEIINVNGASMFEKQANNETRIRSSHDLVSAMASLAPSRKRNVTISGSWNPLAEHSANILDRLNPMTYFGKGKFSNGEVMSPRVLKTGFGVEQLPGYKEIEKAMRGGPNSRARNGGDLTQRHAKANDEYMSHLTDPSYYGNQTAKSPAQEEAEARKALGGRLPTEWSLENEMKYGGRNGRDEGHGGDLIADVKRSNKAVKKALGGSLTLKEYERQNAEYVKNGTPFSGGKIGANILNALGKAAVSAIQDGSIRLTSAIDGSDPHKDAVYGGKIGLNILQALGKAAQAGIEDGSIRLTSAIDGSDPHKDAVYGGKIGINILHALGKAAETAIQDGSIRLTSVIDGTDPHKDAVYGGKIGINILKALGKATETAVEDGSTRLTSVIDGSDPHKDAEYGGEGFPRGSKKALAAMRKARKAQAETAHFEKGSAAAKAKMAKLRAMRGGDVEGMYRGTPEQVQFVEDLQGKHFKPKGGAVRGPNPWLEHVKAYRAKFPHLSYKECLSAAAAVYRK